MFLTDNASVAAVTLSILLGGHVIGQESAGSRMTAESVTHQSTTYQLWTDHWADAVRRGDAETLLTLATWDAFTDRALDGLGLPNGFIAGFKSSVTPKSLADRVIRDIPASIVEGGSYQLIGVVTRQDHPHAIFRWLDGGGGSEFIRSAGLQAIAGASFNTLSLTEKTRKALAYAIGLEKIAGAAAEGNVSKTLALYDEAPVEIRNSQMAKFVRLQVLLFDAEAAPFREAMNEYLGEYPTDVAGLMSSRDFLGGLVMIPI